MFTDVWVQPIMVWDIASSNNDVAMLYMTPMYSKERKKCVNVIDHSFKQEIWKTCDGKMVYVSTMMLF